MTKTLTLLPLFILLCLGCQNQPSESSKVDPIQLEPEVAEETKPALRHTNCDYKNLSETFVFEVEVVQKSVAFYAITIQILNTKTGKRQDAISFSSTRFEGAFTDCNASRSYTTAYRSNSLEAADNNFGDFVVADLNFDGLEDFAVKTVTGERIGPLYDFYVQGKDQLFQLDKDLSMLLMNFPNEINPTTKQLVCTNTVGACKINERRYQLNNETQKWTELSAQLINICE